MLQTVLISCADGAELSASVVLADNARATVVIGSALGVSHLYYQRFAAWLVQQGFNVLSFDYRRTGENRYACDDSALADWGRLDIETVIDYALQLGKPVHFIGHSIGGQLLGLAPSSTKLDKILLVASSAPYWRRWAFPHNLKMLLVGKLVFPLVASLQAEFPSHRFGLGNLTIPSDIFRQWCAWMGAKDYVCDPRFGLDTATYAAITADMLSLGFTDDDLAPERNVAHMLGFYSKANARLRMIAPAETGHSMIGHTGLFRDKFRDSLWRDVLAFLDAKTDGGLQVSG